MFLQELFLSIIVNYSGLPKKLGGFSVNMANLVLSEIAYFMELW